MGQTTKHAESCLLQIAANRSVTKIDIRDFDPKMKPGLFLSLGNVACLRELDIACRATAADIAGLSVLLRKATLLEKVRITLNVDQNVLPFVLNEVPDALQGSQLIRKVEIVVKGASEIMNLDLNNFFTGCARLHRLECFSFSGVRGNRVRLTMDDVVMDRLLGSGIHDIKLEGVDLVDAEQHVGYDYSYGGHVLRRLELEEVEVSPRNVTLFRQVLENRDNDLDELIIRKSGIGCCCFPGTQRVVWVEQILESLGRSKARRISLPCCDMGPSHGQILCQLRQRVAQLVELNISCLTISDEAAQALFQTPCPGSTLKVLTLRQCRIGVDGSHTLSRSLASNSALERLSVTGLFKGLPSECTQTFFEMLGENDSLKFLDISENEITRNEFFALTQSLCSGSMLEELKYADWIGNRNGFLVLGRSLFLNENESLKCLTVSGPFFSPYRLESSLIDCQMFGNALGENKCLQRLDLSNCRLGDAGCAALLSGLGQNRALKEFVLGGNSLGDEACSILANAFLENETLEVFALHSCVAGDDALMEVVDALRTNRSLKYFDVQPEHIGEYGEELGRDALSMLQTNYTLEYFHVPCPLPGFRKSCTFYLRLNQLRRADMLRMSSTGESRDLVLEALLDCTNDLDCIVTILKMNVQSLF